MIPGAGPVATYRDSVQRTLDSLAEDPAGFTEIHAEEALAAADRADADEAAGRPRGLLAGWRVSVKELFDMAGRPTPSGSTILAEAPVARADAPIVTRLRNAGAVILGRTHMSEFAFSGVGLNPHGRQPGNPIDPTRVPGGSSSGAAVSVGSGMADAAVGTDTGGSVRIPAALCGLVGFKPTRRRISRDGATPLALSLDSVGPLAHSVEACRLVDHVLADHPEPAHHALRITDLRLAVVLDLVLDDLDDQVAADFGGALETLAAAGATIQTVRLPRLNRIAEIEAVGPLVSAEAYALHRRMGWIEHRDAYDPNVLFRLEVGGRMSAADYLDARDGWATLAAEARALSADYDALVWPTSPIVAPPIAELDDPKAFGRANGLLLRNARLVNLMDRCAITLPIQAPGALGTGLMLTGEKMGDLRLFAVAEAVERVLKG